MNNYLLSIGWWNFAGSFLMLGLFNESFGKKLMNDWIKIFKEEFKPGYWGKFFMGWAIGLNIFFGLINIRSVEWGYDNVKLFLIYFDIAAYIIFAWLAFWGIRSKRCASGIYAALGIFFFWIVWGFLALN